MGQDVVFKPLHAMFLSKKAEEIGTRNILESPGD